VFFISALCFLMCIMFLVVLIWIHVYAFAIHFMFHCGSAFEPGASGLPYYCTSICVRSCCNWDASCVDSTTKKKGGKSNNLKTQERKKKHTHSLIFLSEYIGTACAELVIRGANPQPWHFTHDSLGLPHADSLSVCLFLWVCVVCVWFLVFLSFYLCFARCVLCVIHIQNHLEYTSVSLFM